MFESIANLCRASKQGVLCRQLYDAPRTHNKDRVSDNPWCKDNQYYYVDKAYRVGYWLD